MESAIISKILAFLLSIFVAIGNYFGFNEQPEEPGEIKNVIYLIGDGMGFNHLEKTKAESGISLTMDRFEIRGSSQTASLTNEVTDSAAGGTALATGVRTGNGRIAVYNDDPNSVYSFPKSLTELCMERGMLTGVITTDSTAGATPASFSAHTASREMSWDISADQLTSGIDLIWGTAASEITLSNTEANGYRYISTFDEMMALPEGSRSFGQFTSSLWTIKPSSENTPNLEQMAVKAVDILDDTDEGFFLMIEGAHIDKHSHNNDSDKMAEALEEFDRTVKAMLSFAKEDGETLVVITADHETGGITFENGSYVFTSGSHSAADVPLLVYGSDELIKNAEVIKNCEIPVRIARILDFDEKQFPVSVKK
ncbi:MAG: alkaline phosphatase [Clostridia bacterium]|nr:alkaline phosphatase [Clostridia bacterium]MBP3441501.1 alkaline phosphatase [Clostridia bacterium]